MNETEVPFMSIIMGSKSDWETMSHAVSVLDQLQVPYEVEIVSTHRTPDKLFQYAERAEERGTEVIIAGAIESTQGHGFTTLHRSGAVPSGIPVGTLAIERAGVSATTIRQGSYWLPPKKSLNMKVRILSGGQLAQIMAIAGKKHGHELRKSYGNDSYRSKS